MSLPRQLDLHADGSLRITPVPELAALRGNHLRQADVSLAGIVPVDELAGDALEIIAEFAVDATDQVGLAVRRTPDGEEETRIVYDAATRRLSIDRTRSSANADVDRDVHSAELVVPDGKLTLHVFLDRSVLEVFANERVTLTSRIYPTRPDALGVAVFGDEADRLRTLDAWELSGIWE